MSALTSMKHFELRFSEIRGSFPNISGWTDLGELMSVQSMRSCCFFNSPAILSQESLRFNQIELTGSLPTEIGSLNVLST
jgi:hypothetical protein